MGTLPARRSRVPGCCPSPTRFYDMDSFRRVFEGRGERSIGFSYRHIDISGRHPRPFALNQTGDDYLSYVLPKLSRFKSALRLPCSPLGVSGAEGNSTRTARWAGDLCGHVAGKRCRVAAWLHGGASTLCPVRGQPARPYNSRPPPHTEAHMKGPMYAIMLAALLVAAPPGALRVSDMRRTCAGAHRAGENGRARPPSRPPMPDGP